MCGIAGYLTADGIPDRLVLQNMCDRLRHRGPDADGYFLDRTVALGHRRLSIIDVNGGDQPVGNEDGSLQVIFNGEIYNYRELREELLARGHCLATVSDTEVLVHLYEDVGERMPEYLNGMFAFALWDKRKQELFLARDRFGKKPLYYSSSISGTRFAFASELTGLMALPGFRADVDHRSVADFLAHGYVPDPASIYKNIFKLAPGHSLTVMRSGERLRRYWAPKFVAGAKADPEETIERIRALSADAVERRMISEVPLGGFLSGGVDSSAVVGLMALRASERVKTFSIGFSERALDETEYANVVAQRYQTDHHREIVTLSVERAFQILLDHYDEPFGDTSAIPMLYLSEMARKHVTVALSGDGADEVFGGYRRYYWEVCEHRLRRLFPKWFRHSVLAFGARHYPTWEYMPRVFRAKATLNFLSKELGDAYFTHLSVFRDVPVESVLSPECLNGLNGYSPRIAYRDRFDQYQHLSPVQQMQAVDLETYLPGDILVKIDRATMAFSLEGRCPWLDYRLSELAGSLPESFLLRGGIGKYIFKQAVAPYLPPEIIHRKKQGFTSPTAGWLRTSLKSRFEALVLRKEMEAYVSMPAVRKLWAEHQAGKNHDRRLWNLLMLGAWDARVRHAPEREMLACH